MSWRANRKAYTVKYSDTHSEQLVDWQVVDNESGEVICFFPVGPLPEEECQRRARLCAEGHRVHLYQKEADEAGQAAGKVLGYPWYKDDPANFPGATEEDGVCIGEHTNVTIVEELARKYKELKEENEHLTEAIHNAGFAIMQTSGKWSIHDVSKQGQAEEEKSFEVATRNVELEVENEKLKATLVKVVMPLEVMVDSEELDGPIRDISPTLRKAIYEAVNEVRSVITK